MYEIKRPQQTVPMHQTSENDHDMENLMTAANDVVFPWVPSLGNLCKSQDRSQNLLEN